MKRLVATIVVASAAAMMATAYPLRSSVGGRNDMEAIPEEPQNLWSWPTEKADTSSMEFMSPNNIWIPEVGKWYDYCSVNGYVVGHASSMWRDAGYFREDSVSTGISGGAYCYGVFLALEPGEYDVTCFTDKRARFWVSFYEEVDGGYRWLGNDKLSVGNPLGGAYSSTFFVPEEAVLTLLLPRPYYSDATLTTTDLAIHRID